MVKPNVNTTIAPTGGTSAPDVTIIDCGIGNIKSVQRMFEAVDADALIADHPNQLAGAQRLVLPGVGAFDAGMRALADGNWIDALNRRVLDEGMPVLGICLGMQLLCRGSEEGNLPGLGWIAADVRRIDTGGDDRLKIPHMGWTVTEPAQPNPLLSDDGEEQRFYYVHSFRVVCDDPADVLASATYGTRFTCSVHHDNIYGVQFHPEKSHKFGMGLLKRFLAIPC